MLAFHRRPIEIAEHAEHHLAGLELVLGIYPAEDALHAQVETGGFAIGQDAGILADIFTRVELAQLMLQIASRIEHARVSIVELERAPWRRRLLQLIVPLGCIALYLIWTGSGIHQHAIMHLIMPVTTKGWLLIFPYVLLLLVLLVRDNVQIWKLRRFLAKETGGGEPETLVSASARNGAAG